MSVLKYLYPFLGLRNFSKMFRLDIFPDINIWRVFVSVVVVEKWCFSVFLRNKSAEIKFNFFNQIKFLKFKILFFFNFALVAIYKDS